MKTKKTYIAANIKAGNKPHILSAYYATRDNLPTTWSVTIETFDHSHDVYGNGVAHYTAYVEDATYNRFIIVESGKRREQVGYSGKNQAALHALECLGYDVDTSKFGNYDYQGVAVYPLLNFPVVAL